MLFIRTYAQEGERSWLTDFWNTVLGSPWTLNSQELDSHLLSATVLLVAECDGKRVGFIATGISGSGTGAILAILVDKEHRRRGVGSALLRRAEAILRTAGVARCSIGTDGQGDYFWPGVPVGLTDAWPFFESQGWRQRDRCADLLLDLRQYQSPNWVRERVSAARVALELGTIATATAIYAFEHKHFPAWSEYFYDALTRKRFENILVARNEDGRIVGTVMLSGAGSVSWAGGLGSRCGTLNVLGVAPSEQGRGIGLGLVDCAAKLLRDRGCASCLIGETGLTKWYGKLGAKTWSEYYIANKRLDTEVAFAEASIVLQLLTRQQIQQP